MKILVGFFGYAAVYGNHSPVKVKKRAARITTKQPAVRLHGFVLVADHSAYSHYNPPFLVKTTGVSQAKTPITQ